MSEQLNFDPRITMQVTGQDEYYLTAKRKDYKGAVQFWEELDKFYKAGYEICFDAYDKRNPRLGNIPRVLMVKSGSQVSNVELVQDSVEESEQEGSVSLQDLTKKTDLLAFASEAGIEVPDNLKQPAAIKKYLEEKVAE